MNERVAKIALNFGIVQHIDATVTNIRVGGGQDVAAALATLLQAVLDSKDLVPDAKEAALEQVDHLATQAREPAPKRQPAVAKLAIDALTTTLGGANDVATIWQTVEPILRGIFTKTPVDREQLRRDLSDALQALQRDQDVTGLDVLAASLTTLESPYAFHGVMIQRNLAVVPRPDSALMWSLTQVIGKLEGR